MKTLFKMLALSGAAALLAFGTSWIIYMPNSAERGVWRLATGGIVIELTPLTATLYSETRHSCLKDLVFPAHLKLVELAEGAVVTVDNDQLILSVDGSLDARRFDKIDALPQACTDPIPSTATPHDVFTAVWTAMDDHYAFFDLHNVNWADRKALIPAPETQMSDDELTQGLLDMMEGIDDGHVHFGSDAIGFDSPSQRPAWIPADGSITRQSLFDTALNAAATPLTKAEGAEVYFGLRPDGIGYIMVREMDVTVPFGGNSTDAMAGVFEKVLAELSNAKALLIDVRYNPGGSDTVSFGIASHFTAKSIDVFSKTTKNGDTQTDPFTAVLHPFDSTSEDRPTVVMTSRLTGSAAEIFTMAMREIPNVVILGEPTSGGLSDVMGFVLPNDWRLGLSNQTYLSMDGALFESIGVPVDVAVDYDTSAYQSGQDPVMDAAIAHLIAEILN